MGYGWIHSYNIFLFDQLGAMFRFDTDSVTRYGLGSCGTYITGDFETLVKKPQRHLQAYSEGLDGLQLRLHPQHAVLCGRSGVAAHQSRGRNGNQTTLT